MIIKKIINNNRKKKRVDRKKERKRGRRYLLHDCRLLLDHTGRYENAFVVELRKPPLWGT